ncbi:MAG: hypothetical protein E6K19_02830 [Methanobacteriota archaeon]|nr:MAG: hypothetical protein E6K19_02830 [Euryarchaeota archaeon]
MAVRSRLRKVAAAATIASLLSVALVGLASALSTAARPDVSLAAGPPLPDSQSSPMFDSFQYEKGQALGTYVQFAYDSANGTVKSVLGLSKDLPVLYVGSIAISGFAPARGESTVGSTFRAEGYLATITAHDDPTSLIEIRTDMARTVAIELPADATNISLLAATGSWPAATVLYSVGEEQARFLLGAGTFSVSGTRLVARMSDSDLLVFKSVPPLTANRSEWQIVLDAITAGRIVAEMNLVATSGGQWIQNIVRYRIGLAAWALAVRPSAVAVQIDSLIPGGAVVLLSFDSATIPLGEPRRLVVKANGHEMDRTDDSLMLLFANEGIRGAPRFAVLSLPGTALALYLPSLAAISIEVGSFLPPPRETAFDLGTEIAMIAALGIVCVAAVRMLRGRLE